MGGKNENKRVASPESVLIRLNDYVNSTGSAHPYSLTQAFAVQPKYINSPEFTGTEPRLLLNSIELQTGLHLAICRHVQPHFCKTQLQAPIVIVCVTQTK